MSAVDAEAYRELFTEEAREHLDALADGLTRMQSGARVDDDTQALFRAAHSLKGMAATLGHDAEARLAHALEDQLSRLDAGKDVPVGLLLEAVEALRQAVEAIARKAPRVELEDVIQALERPGDTASTKPPAPSTMEHGTQPDEPPPANMPSKEAEPEPGAESAGAGVELDASAPKVSYIPPSVRIDAGRLDAILDRTAALRTTQGRLERLLEEVLPERPGYSLSEALGRLERETHELYAQTLQLRTLPASLLTRPLVRRAQQTASRHGKQIHLELEGNDLLLDRSLLDAMGDPLLHLLTNAVVHGIETPDERKRAGKSAKGTIQVTLEREGGMLVVTVRDDGAGIDLDAVRQRAVEQGHVTKEQVRSMTTKSLIELVTRPGFTTTTQLTQEAGRGVGLDAVADAVHRVGGRIRLDTTRGQGTTVRLTLPPTLSLLEVVPIIVAGQPYAVAAGQVRRVVPLSDQDLALGQIRLDGDGATHGEKTVKITSLAEALALDTDAAPYPVGEGEQAPIIQQAKKIKQAAEQSNSRTHPQSATLQQTTKPPATMTDPRTRYRAVHRPLADAAAEDENGVGLVVEQDGRSLVLRVERSEAPEQAIVKPLHLPTGTPPGASGAIVMRDGRLAIVLDAAEILRRLTPEGSL